MSQTARVVAAMKDGKWRTLRQMESLIYSLSGIADTQTAISARLREGAKLAKFGYTKESRFECDGSKRVWFYRLARCEVKK